MAGQFVIKQIAQEVISEVNQPLYIGGIDPLGSDSKLTIASNGNVSTATPLTVPSLTVASKPVVNSLLAEYTVTGSAVTSIDFSGLDINTHKSYRVEMELYNPTTGSLLYMFVNNDTTLTNYYTQTLNATSATVTAVRDNMPDVAYTDATSRIIMALSVRLITGGYVSSISNTTRQTGSGVMQHNFHVTKTATVTNITQLTFAASVANSIGVGSTIRIYRQDV